MDESTEPESTELPEAVIVQVTRLTRHMRRAVDDNEIEAYRDRRSELLDEYGFTARIRDDDPEPVLVCYPEEWLDEQGTVRTERIENIDRGVERPLGGPGDPDDWDAVDEHNNEIAADVRDQHGPVHGENADAFADYMSNHCAKRIESATPEDIERFESDFFVRNCWPSDEQQATVATSIEKTFEVAGVPDPRSPP